MTAAVVERTTGRPGTASRARMLRAMLPALSLALVLIAIAWLNPRAISYFGFSLMLNLAIPIALATIAQMFVITVNELDLSIGPFVGFVGCVAATWLHDTPPLGFAILLAAIAGCSALDVEAITHKRTTSTTYDVHAEGTKVRDEHGNHLTGMRVSFDIAFPDGPEGDLARERVQGAIEMSRDRLCTVSRTVQLGEDVTYVDESGRDSTAS